MKRKMIGALLFAACLLTGPDDKAVYAAEDGGALLSTEDTVLENETETEEAVSDEEDSEAELMMAGVDAISMIEAPVLLETEAKNVNSVLLGSISHALNAAITLEQAKMPEYSEEDLMYLSCIIYCEAGSQSFEGRVAVANVVMNRAESDVFDHVTTIREAIYDCNRWGRQFSPVYVKSNGKWTTKGSTYEKVLTMYKTGKYGKDWEKKQMQGCIDAAKAALEGKNVLDKDYLYFNMNITSTKNRCKNAGKSWQIIDSHIFY